MEDKSAEIEYRPSEENDELLDNNDISVPHINFLYKKAKRNHLINEISRNRQLELKGLVAQQYTEIKHKNHGKKIKDTEKEINFLKGELSSINQLLSNLHNKNSTRFIQGDAFP